jgi:hypothetical protein
MKSFPAPVRGWIRNESKVANKPGGADILDNWFPTAAGVRATGHEELKTAPKGYAKDHPRIDLLRHKGLVAWREWPPAAWLGTRRAKDRVVEFLESSQPLNDWLRDNVGPSTLPERRR